MRRLKKNRFGFRFSGILNPGQGAGFLCNLPVFFLLTTLFDGMSLSAHEPFVVPPSKKSERSVRLVADADKPTGQIQGPNERIQLLMLGNSADGKTVDLTRNAQFTVQPKGILSVDAGGRVTPLGNGTAEIRARTEWGDASTSVTVSRFAQPPSINFGNDIVPIFTKFACNSGGCHGKSGGQNGFALSLLGFEPKEDYQYVVKESRGRRVFPAAPEKSLLLQKAIGEVPHGGGARIKKASYEYRLLKQWVAQGMPFGRESDPVLSEVTVLPARAKLDLDARQQLKVIAKYSDGSHKDVTNQAQYIPNNTELANASEEGVVEVKGLAGTVAVMVRFQDKAAAFLATIPLGEKISQLPAEATLVDRHVFANLKELGLPPSMISTDSVFIRRVSLDIAGRLPTREEAEAFVEDKDPKKREKLVDRLLDSDDYANYFAQKWTSILKNRVGNNEPRAGNFLFHDWIRQNLADNKPYDQWVAELVTASGDVRTNPAVNWHLKFNKMEERAEDTAQVFLGQRIQCAKCHHHPYEKWSQEDYWRFAAFFSNLSQKTGRRVYTKPGIARARNTKDNQMVTAAGLGGEDLGEFRGDVRIQLANWMTHPDNPYFARMLVNRYWKHFMGVGIVEPEDDLRGTNPPSNPELLAGLESSFKQSGFDTRQLIKTICNSSTYQLSALPNEHNRSDKQSFSKFNPRRLPAEVMLDSIDAFLGSESRFRGLPVGTTATRIPDHGMANNSFLDTFGRPAGASACECERSGEITMAQCLQLLNSDDMHSKLNASFVGQLARDPGLDNREKIRQLHWMAFARDPRPKEYTAYLSYLEATDNQDVYQAFQDVMWTMINTKEFLFNH
ncbi:MAG: DUF1549 and DUF1553 domain-containing protein [Planctomycetota bacterium]|nr:DUF1549 and DUF1553 domain-containing protein [Planctomycetota bacterium]